MREVSLVKLGAQQPPALRRCTQCYLYFPEYFSDFWQQLSLLSLWGREYFGKKIYFEMKMIITWEKLPPNRFRISDYGNLYF
jgi:hypothetical protein